MKKIFLTCFGVICLAFCLINMSPYISFAASSGTCGDNVTWTLDDNGVLTISGTGPMKDYDLASWNTAPWNKSFPEPENSVKAVCINPGVTSIGRAAFGGCASLSQITIPETVTLIDFWAFDDCSSLLEITLPGTISYIDFNAFTGCTNLQNIKVKSSNNYYTTIDGVLFNKDMNTIVKYPANKQLIGYSIPESVTNIAKNAFCDASKLQIIHIPESVKSIGDYAFNYCSNLLSIEIPDVTNFGYSVFRGCNNLTQIEFPDCMTTFDFYQLEGCSSITSIILPKSLVSIDAYSYPPRNLKYIFYKGSQSDWEQLTGSNSNFTNMLSNITVIFDYSDDFYWYIENGTLIINANGDMPVWNSPTNTPWANMKNEIHNIEISSGATNIGDFAFSDCKNLLSVSLPDTIKSIGKSAFRGTCITELSIPDSVTTIAPNAFRDCIYLESISLSDNINCIDKYAFSNCESLHSVIIPVGVESIKNGAFSNCENLSTIDIPSTITQIGNATFDGCTELKTVNYSGSNRNWNNITIGKENAYLLDADINFAIVDGDEMSTEISDVSLTDATVTVTVNNIPTSSKVFATTYDIDGQFKHLYMLDVTGTTATTKVSAENIYQIKVFAWKDFETLLPLCDTKNITISK